MLVGHNCFITITKYSIKKRLKELKIKPKYQEQICDGVKAIVKDSLDDIISQSIEQNRMIEGQVTLGKYKREK